jgi:hypothetical protein
MLVKIIKRYLIIVFILGCRSENDVIEGQLLIHESINRITSVTYNNNKGENEIIINLKDSLKDLELISDVYFYPKNPIGDKYFYINKEANCRNNIISIQFNNSELIYSPSSQNQISFDDAHDSIKDYWNNISLDTFDLVLFRLISKKFNYFKLNSDSTISIQRFIEFRYTSNGIFDQRPDTIYRIKEDLSKNDYKKLKKLIK